MSLEPYTPSPTYFFLKDFDEVQRLLLYLDTVVFNR